MRRYKYSVNFTLDEYSDWDLFEFKKNDYSLGENLYEKILDWESPVYHDTQYFLEEYRDQAVAYLKSKNYTESEIAAIDPDTLESDILRACSDSWNSSVESGIMDLYKDKIKNPGFEYSAYAFLDSKGKQTKYLWEAVSVDYYFTAKFWRENIYDSTEYGSIRKALEYADDDIAEYCTDNLEVLTTRNYGDFHLVQDNADIDKYFLDCFSNYNESESEMIEHRKELAKQKANKEYRLKGLIKNHVSLGVRAVVLSTLS